MTDTEELILLRRFLHFREMHPFYEYMTTEGPRKDWCDINVPPGGEGWENNEDIGRNGWERYAWHEESYWKRKKKDENNE